VSESYGWRGCLFLQLIYGPKLANLHSLNSQQSSFFTSTPKDAHMNWDQIQGNWKQVTGKAKEQWGKLTDDDMDIVAGRRDQLAGKIQERYGVAKDVAEKQVADWEKTATDSWFKK
jgi:uncharacterized protein YjbJ (UPF0337 family)